MPKAQIILLLVAILLIVGMYQLPKVVVSDQEDIAASRQNTPPSNEDMADLHQTPLPTSLQAKLKDLKNSYTNSDSPQKKVIFADSIAALFKSVNQYDSVVYYKQKAAELAPNLKRKLQAANAYYDAYNFYAVINEAQAINYAEQARLLYQQVLEEDTSNLDAKAKLASTYFLGGNPMQGVRLLLDILEENPEHEFTLFQLGLRSMQSGQYDKAVKRFEKLLSVNPTNSEAKIFLAQSYAELGEKDKAIPLLETVKNTEQDSLLRSAADDYLKQLIN